MSRTDFARDAVRTVRGPTSTVYACPFCKHLTKFHKGTTGNGRGYGLRMGGTLHSQMAAHIRATHAAELAAYAERKATTP